MSLDKDREIAELAREVESLTELRAGMIEAAAMAAEITDRALAQVDAMRPVVLAACRACLSSSVQLPQDLVSAVSAYLSGTA